MKQKHLAQIFTPLFIATVLLLGSCRKSEEIGLGNSGLVSVGFNTELKLVSFQPTLDNGYVLVANTRQNENQDITVLKYNHRLVLQWERVIGAHYDDVAQKIFIDKNQNILISGFSYGFNQDTLMPRRSRDWIPYFHLLNPTGVTLWESAKLFDVYSLTNQTFNDVIQNNQGNYIVSGKIKAYVLDSNGNLQNSNLYPVILNFNINGTYSSLFGRSIKTQDAGIESIFGSNDKVYAFGHDLESKNQAEYFSINPNDMKGLNRCKLIDTIDWQSSVQTIDPILATLKVQKGGILQTFIINRNWVYRYELNVALAELTSEHIPIHFKDITWAGQSTNTFLFITNNSWIYETDYSLKITKSFHSEYPIQQIHKNFDGGYVGVANVNDAIQLIRLNSTGQVLDYE